MNNSSLLSVFLKAVQILLSSLLFLVILTCYDSKSYADSTPGSLPECVTISHCVRIDWKVDNVNESFKKAIELIKTTPRTKIVQLNKSYIHAEATSRIMRYVDDLELIPMKEKSILQIRSESRVGISDMGVNKKRVKDLLDLL